MKKTDLSVNTATLILLLFYCTFLRGQDYQIKDILVEDYGYSHTLPNKLLIDKNGFLWYTCPTGIVRNIDSHDTFFSNQGNGNKAYSNISSAILQDSKSKIWVISSSEIYFFDQDTEVMHTIPLKLPKCWINNVNFTSIIEDCNQNIWIGTSRSYILKIDKARKVKIFRLPKIEDVPHSDNFFKIEKIIDCKTILVQNKIYGITDSGLRLKADLTTLFKSTHKTHESPKIHPNEDESVLVTKNGAVFPKSKSGTYLFNGKQFHYFYIKNLDIQVVLLPFSKIYYTKNETLPGQFYAIAPSERKLVFLKLDATRAIPYLAEQIKIGCDYAIDDVVVDKLGIVYVSSYNKISKIKFRNWQLKKILNNDGALNNLPNISTRGFVELADGTILVGSYSGIFQLSCKNNLYHYKRVFPDIFYVRNFERVNDSIVYGMGDNINIMKINTHSMTSQLSAYANIEGRHGYDLVKVSDSTLLLAYDTGLYELNYLNNKIKKINLLSSKHDISDCTISDLYLAGNTLYISTYGRGLFIKDLVTGRVENLTRGTNGLLSNTIQSVFVDSEGILWIASDKGINYKNKGSAKVLKIKVSANPSVLNSCGFLEDGNRNIWISTFEGLFQYNRAKKKTFSYHLGDGLPADEFNLQSYFKSSKGRLFFGGVNGIVYFDNVKADSDDYYSSKIFPIQNIQFKEDLKTVVTSNIFNREKNKLSLPYYNNYLSIRFSLKNVFDNDKNQYLYTMDGLSNDWINIGNRNFIDLFSLSPGNHVLRIKGVNAKGIESSNILTYKIKVQNIFYKELWFLILCVSILITVTIVIIYFYLRKQKVKLFIQQALIESERKTLMSQMNPHFIFNILNTIQNKIINKANFYSIENYIVNLSKLMRLTLTLTRHENINIAQELNYLKTYLELENSMRSDKIDFKINCAPEINIDETYIPSMMIQPIIENSVVHGFKDDSNNEKMILLKISMEPIKKEVLIIQIEDNGVGFLHTSKIDNHNNTTHISYATQILLERIKLLNHQKKKKDLYKIEIKNLMEDKGRGALVLLTLPVH